MATAGYSGTPLIKKLGIKPATRLLLVNPPGDYGALLGEDIRENLAGKDEIPDMIHLFVLSEDTFCNAMQQLKSIIHPRVVIWVSWHKKTSGIKTDVTEETIRQYALRNGLVDVKVCAIDEKWSALKLVVPLSKR